MLIHGEVIESDLEQKVIETLHEDCLETLRKGNPITADKVMKACDVLYQKVMLGELDDVLFPLLHMTEISYERFQAMAKLFSRKELEYKCKIELGSKSGELEPLKNGTQRKRYPLGILFHIAAGNVDGLPAYSVIEGLLAGNINILKLPTGDNGVSVKILSELIKCDPDLRDYIYVFDVPSTDTHTLETFADIADAVVVWGGDEAAEAARMLADVKTKIITWGHKLSFAYVTENAEEEALYKLALHICETNQVLCSSCQGIYFDTDQRERLEEFADYFFELLRKANAELGKVDMGMRGRNSIRIYNELLENRSGQKILNKDGVSVIIKDDSELELSFMFRNTWVKALPHGQIVATLKKHKNHLQTCGLLSANSEKASISEFLARAGVVRITNGDMSRILPGEAHDGTYPLREYSRIVEID